MRKTVMIAAALMLGASPMAMAQTAPESATPASPKVAPKTGEKMHRHKMAPKSSEATPAPQSDTMVPDDTQTTAPDTTGTEMTPGDTSDDNSAAPMMDEPGSGTTTDDSGSTDDGTSAPPSAR